MIKSLVLGALISIADLIPGISGGTIMMISGKYYQIVHYVNEMVKLKFTKESSKFVFPIAIGWIVGIFSFVRLINYLMINYRIEMYGLFSGLIIGGSIYILKDIKKKEKELSILTVSISFIASLIIFLLLKQRLSPNINPSWLYLFVSAVLASLVMPLPGISGSTIFLILGVYSFIIKSLSHREFIILIPIILGIIIGWFSSIKILSTLLEKYKKRTLEILLGITMAGAVKIFPLSISIYPYLYACIGLAISFGVELYFSE
jgi:putative membrane protein